MKVLEVLFLCFLFVAFCSISKAQVCGPSITRVYVKNNNGNYLQNVKFDFVNSAKMRFYSKAKWLSFKENAYLISFLQSKPYGDHLLRISLKGFETIEKNIRISEAQNQIFEVVLKRINTNEKSKFDELITFWGKVTDNNYGAISNSRVSLTDERNNKVERTTNDAGEYIFEVLEGKYKIEITDTNGFAPLVFEKYSIAAGSSHLDVRLEVDSSKVIVTELVCSPHKYLANYFDCVLVCKYPTNKNNK